VAPTADLWLRQPGATLSYKIDAPMFKVIALLLKITHTGTKQFCLHVYVIFITNFEDYRL